MSGIWRQYRHWWGRVNWMGREVVVADSGPLIGLARIGRFALLKTLFRYIISNEGNLRC